MYWLRSWNTYRKYAYLSVTSRTSLKHSKNSKRVRKSPKSRFGILHRMGVGSGRALRSSQSKSSRGFFHSAITSLSSLACSFFLSFSLALSSIFRFLSSSALCRISSLKSLEVEIFELMVKQAFFDIFPHAKPTRVGETAKIS